MRVNLKNLTVQVIIAIIIGVFIGQIFPTFGVQLKVLADVFIKLIKMVIVPIVFLTIVIGINNMGSLKKVGRIGGKALLYFELVTTLAMIIGVSVMYFVQPGKGMDTSQLGKAAADVAKITKQANDASQGWIDFLVNIVPDNVIGAFAKGDMLPVLFFALLFAFALLPLKERSKPLTDLLERLNEVFFKIVGIIMRVSPLAAGGAMAFTIGKFGIGSLFSLGKMMACVYITMFLFIVIVLGLIARYFGFNIFNLLKFIKGEILLVLGTSSSESALPSLMKRLEQYGCSKSVVGLVVPTGYSFNPDGSSLYMVMAPLFIAQAFDVHLNWAQLLTMLGVAMLISKGAAGVSGTAFVATASLLTALPGHIIPIEGMALLLGVDRFMSEARAITNMIGNAVATVVISKSENQFDNSKSKNLPVANEDNAFSV
ncbi:aerobic C4-dicarboxylate transport protein [Paenibacillus sp. V4I3]|uniref:C4-dicarboxylate transporter DctA n=1 Tax=unclassified Paenibacillus TaxID=185978 RepID=UPI00277DF723|nr:MULTISPECIES: C4-dicarboxylate transporter DctA [unclassified Paenibacillus]MDQ0874426.1 aerobic C4-dicarboxylate transport protein [Paenibacillus sp. V4I3]MDQ0889860.1 aerobic C4-dicarboxylate transport protein [Paenibacillus sp. V4I9]